MINVVEGEKCGCIYQDEQAGREACDLMIGRTAAGHPYVLEAKEGEAACLLLRAARCPRGVSRNAGEVPLNTGQAGQALLPSFRRR